MNVSCEVHSFSLEFIGLLLLFFAFSCLLFGAKLVPNPGFSNYLILLARLWAVMIRYDAR